MSKQGKPQQEAVILQPAHWLLRRELSSAIEEQVRVNNEVLDHFKSWAPEFYSAIGEVKYFVGQLEISFVVNGGEKTAAAMGKCADQLLAAYSALHRVKESLANNPFADIKHQELNELLDYCKAMYTAAAEYTTATGTDRSSTQRKFASALAQAKPLFAALYSNPNHSNEALSIITEMLITRRNKGMTTRKALRDIQKSDPKLILQIFGVEPNSKITDQACDYARKLIERG